MGRKKSELSRSERLKLKRLERRELGVCTKCAVPLDPIKDKGCVTCYRCRKHWADVLYPNSKRASNRRIWSLRGQCGDCWVCGKFLPMGYEKKVCPECINKIQRPNAQKRWKKD